MISLEIAQRNYLPEQLDALTIGTFTPYQQRLVKFCQKYLSGQTEFYLQTSGSTGSPKTISITRQQMQISALSTIKVLGLSQGVRLLVCINTDYIGGKMMLVRGMELGAHMKIVSPKARLTSLEPVDFVALVPLQVYRLLESSTGRDFLQNCPKVIIGGAPLANTALRDLQKFTNEIYQTFGMTETVSHIALKKLSAGNKDQPFEALPQVTFSKDDRGCLIIKGPMTNFQEVKTQDLVELLDEQHFRWLSRVDEVINSGGHKVYPPLVMDAVSAAIGQLGITGNFLILGQPHADLGERVVLVLEGPPLSPPQEVALLTLLKQSLHAYEVPKKILYLPKLARLKSGKIDINAVRHAI